MAAVQAFMVQNLVHLIPETNAFHFNVPHLLPQEDLTRHASREPAGYSSVAGGTEYRHREPAADSSASGLRSAPEFRPPRLSPLTQITPSCPYAKGCQGRVLSPCRQAVPSHDQDALPVTRCESANNPYSKRWFSPPRFERYCTADFAFPIYRLDTETRAPHLQPSTSIARSIERLGQEY